MATILVVAVPAVSVPTLNVRTPPLGVTPPSAARADAPSGTGTLSVTAVAAAGPRLATVNV